MTTFVYKAKKPTAETVTGQIHATTQDEAIDIINNLGLLPVSVEAVSDKEQASRFTRFQKIKSKDVYIFSRQLSNLLKSGIGLLRALMIIEEQTTQPSLKKIIAQMAQSIKNGKPFSDCLSDYPQIFSSLFITMVRAGEESGRLQEMLVNVSYYQQKQEEMLTKVRTALAYPAFMAGVGLLTVYFILTFTLPKMSSMFNNVGQSLPLVTRILLAVSAILSKFWLWILLGLGFIGLAFERYRTSVQGSQFLSLMALKFPVIGEIVLKSELARFARTMVLLLKSGISIIAALDVAVPVIKNQVLRKELSECRTKLLAGGTWGESLRRCSHCPSMVAHLVTIGEESGNLSDILSELMQTYEQETEEKIKIFTTLFEPAMILLIGSMIAFIVFAMLLPIFQFDALAK